MNNNTIKYSGRVKTIICKRLTNDWQDLADYFDIQLHEREGFRSGRQAHGVWEWLEQRDRIGELESALNDIGRDDLVEELKKKLVDGESTSLCLAKLFNVPKLPDNFLPRDEQLQPLKQKVLSHTNQPVGITSTTRRVGLQGMGGIGKTVLATALARDEDIRKKFFDGIFWITLGQRPKLLDWQLYLSETLGDNQATFTEISFGKAKLKQLFADKSCLLILDDIWNLNHATTFDVLGEKCQMLVTTRDASIITSFGAVRHELAVLSQEQSLTLLADWAGYKDNTLLPPEANQVVEECGNLPLALSMVGAMLRGKPNLWGNVLQKLLPC
ncbi:NB-ARC domain-containing protein [Rivularia sp. PCC 7116]|uniref:NB-ARC domain-containing protein n=1 Tax=Rivularia sp. PCC 7116 TaxID=373994 RepID=UPI0005C7A834|nr:NB-ARC domain-containing protein [Rivularia sp. PCC 7116]